MDDYTLFLKTQFPHLITEQNYLFSKHACIGCGGVAKVAVYPQTQAETVALINALKRTGASYCLLGNLSNVLPPDGAYDKIPIITQRLSGIRREKDELFVEAGATSGKFLHFCKENGLSGAEFLTGIPCTVGGATYMNAGVSGVYMHEIVSSVLAYVDGKIVRINKAECDFSYKHTVFMKGDAVILGTYFRLREKTPNDVQAEIAFYAQKRRHLPTGKSMGCVFKNPKGQTAGALIEGAGLKGLSFGGAKISEQHANFIINENACNSKEIRSLIKIVKKAVAEKYSVNLEEEIIYI